MKLHELSPGSPSSDKLRRECPGYTSSQFFPSVPPGTLHKGERCEDLHALTFSDASFDLVVTQDVFEHVPAPDRGFREIARVLKPEGAHIFTVPLYAGRRSVVRARLTDDGSVTRYLPDEFHGNPVDPKGSLVTTEWGDDIVDFIAESSGLKTSIHHYKNRRLGLDGEFLYVFISRRPMGAGEVANFN